MAAFGCAATSSSEEGVQLREERVSLERRSVDRPVSPTGDVFPDRSVELDERADEAVIDKDVRIKEELVVGKEESVRTQKVADKVRHTEVEVSDERDNLTRDVDESLRTERDAGRTTRGKL
jgi:stress response protein YsnF